MALLEFQSLQQCLEGLHGLAMVVALCRYERLQLSYLLLLQHRQNTHAISDWIQLKEGQFPLITAVQYNTLITVTPV